MKDAAIKTDCVKDYENLIQEALDNGQIIIYGAHLVAKELYLYLKRLEKKFHFLGFAVTSANDNPLELEGKKVLSLDFYEQRKSAYVLIAMPEKYHEEVELYLVKHGFFKFSGIGIRGISYLLGDGIVNYWKCRSNGKYILLKSAADFSWLDLCEDKSVLDIRKTRHYKFPIMTRLSIEESFARLNCFSFVEDYEQILGKYRNVAGLSVTNANTYARGMFDVYMVTSHKDSKNNRKYNVPDWTQLIQAGSTLADYHIGKFHDDEGENISKKNESYAEMTAMYWIWKNSRKSTYKGLCHYRRHFDIDDRGIAGIVENEIDVVLTTPRLVLNGLKAMFIQDTPVKEDVFQNMLDSIKEVWGRKMLNDAEQYYNSVLYYPNNMLIAREDIFNDYCEWIFPVLFQMEKSERVKGIIKKDRHLAFAAELLTSFYFVMNRNNYKIAVTDYIFLGTD